MQMRRTAAWTPLAVAAVVVLAGCGGSSDYKNDPRPPAPIVLTASIDDQRVSVSPRSFGAGPISLVVTNQTSTAQRVTLESPQALFRDVLLKDTKTASGVERLLRTNAGFVSPTPVFSDLTGDGKSDAV